MVVVMHKLLLIWLKEATDLAALLVASISTTDRECFDTAYRQCSVLLSWFAYNSIPPLAVNSMSTSG